MKEKFKKFKEFTSDKRNGALVKLGFWFIFLLFVIIYVRIMNSKTPNYANNPVDDLPQTITEGVKSFKNVNTYECSIEYTYNGNILKVDGKKYNDKWLFNYNDNEYYYDGNLYLLKENEKEEVDKTNIEYLLMFDIQKVYDYLLNSKYVSKTENVNNELIITSNLTLEDTLNKIETVNKGNNLESINMDLTNYYKTKDENCVNLNIVIKYSNLNNVEDFSY